MAIRVMLWMLCGAVALTLAPPATAAGGQLAIAVADFDYGDTSGEAVDQAAAHRERMAIFDATLRDALARRDYRVTRPNCPQLNCTAAGMAPDDLAKAARRDGARYLVYGGIRKMSTLVQWGEVQLVDIDRDELLLRRTVSFRGDTDAAFRHAADFVGETVRDALAVR